MPVTSSSWERPDVPAKVLNDAMQRASVAKTAA
jgi:hypothetical protein